MSGRRTSTPSRPDHRGGVQADRQLHRRQACVDHARAFASALNAVHAQPHAADTARPPAIRGRPALPLSPATAVGAIKRQQRRGRAATWAGHRASAPRHGRAGAPPGDGRYYRRARRCRSATSAAGRDLDCGVSGRRRLRPARPLQPEITYRVYAYLKLTTSSPDVPRSLKPCARSSLMLLPVVYPAGSNDGSHSKNGGFAAGRPFPI